MTPKSIMPTAPSCIDILVHDICSWRSTTLSMRKKLTSSTANSEWWHVHFICDSYYTYPPSNQTKQELHGISFQLNWVMNGPLHKPTPTDQAITRINTDHSGHRKRSQQLGAAANFDNLVKSGDRRQIRRSRMFIKLAFEFGCDVRSCGH